MVERVLVVGTGSIARRHMSNAKMLFEGATVVCVPASGRTVAPNEVAADELHPSLASALRRRPDFAVIGSPAPFHLAQASELLSAGIPVLIEKPLTHSLDEFRRHAAVLEANRERLDVGYNLRLLESAQCFARQLAERRIGRLHRVSIEVGQYLPDWRPGSDYRRNVSAQRSLGGGVLLELSHELDYLGWLFGAFDSAYCIATSSGALQIDVEDRVDAILGRSDGLVATLHMDFLQRTATRACKVVGEHGNLTWNVATNTVELSAAGRQEVLFSAPDYDRNDMYRAELLRFVKVASGQLPPLVGLDAALRTLQLVQTLRRSASCGQAVALGEQP
jgi:predicted dehydrogenase